jgi:amino acid transporter
MVVRRLGFLDAFFLAFGGQSILLSLLTYGAAAIALAGYFSPVAVALGSAIVVLNGLVVQRLSNLYTQNGGYYNYAKKLGAKVGLHTGWMYISYASVYGAAYVVGTAFVVGYALGVSPSLIALVITAAAITLVVLGVKPSSKYAVATGILEISVILFIIIDSLVHTNMAVYNPLSNLRLGRGVPLAILLGASIPTGYGILAQVSGEVVEAERNVGRAMITVVVISGILASIYVFALSNLAYTMSVRVHTLDAPNTLNLVAELSYAMRPVIVFGVLSDGVLGAMAYLMAATRTLWKMSQDGHMPGWFTKLRRGEPINTLTILGPIYLVVATATTLFVPVFQDFVALGVVAALCSLYIHFVANTSLFTHRSGVKRDPWRLVALLAMCYTAFNFGFSIYDGKIIYSVMFVALSLVGLAFMATRPTRRSAHHMDAHSEDTYSG